MKRLWTTRRERYRRIVRKRAKRSRAARVKRRSTRPSRGSRRRRTSPLRVLAPEAFSLEHANERRKLLRMIATIRQHAIKNGTPVLIDFSATRRMYPSGTLFFLAELDRLRVACGDRQLFRGNYPRDRVVEQVLQQVGILGMLHLKARLSTSSFPENVRHWKHASDELAEGKKAGPLVERYTGRLATSLTRGLYAGITEAMTNSVQHAYVGERGDELSDRQSARCRRWWMFSQERDGKLTVALCDLGIGIPASLADAEKWAPDFIERLLASLGFGAQDSSLIRAAVEIHRTSTGMEHRGKGLGEILDVVRKARSGHLSIMSNRGFFRHNGATGEDESRDYPGSILGTLVQWEIPLPESGT